MTEFFLKKRSLQYVLAKSQQRKKNYFLGTLEQYYKKMKIM